jgi:hypothetical protein
VCYEAKEFLDQLSKYYHLDWDILRAGLLVGWLVGWLVSCLVDWLVSWPFGRLVSWLLTVISVNMSHKFIIHASKFMDYVLMNSSVHERKE